MTQISIDMPDDIAQELLRRAPPPADRLRLVETIFREYFAGNGKASELELLTPNNHRTSDARLAASGLALAAKRARDLLNIGRISGSNSVRR